MEPTTAKGAAMMRFPTQAIRYPPLAATLSTATVRRIWRDRMRWSCDAASPCSWTRPPEFSSRSSTSSSGVAIVSTAVTSSRSEETAVALMSPRKLRTKIRLRDFDAPASFLFSSACLRAFLALSIFLNCFLLSIASFKMSDISSYFSLRHLTSNLSGGRPLR